MKKEVPHMGEGTSSVFSGQGIIETNRINYGETASFFAERIKQELPVSLRSYELADIGTFRGELLKDILKLLPEYKFHTTGVDIIEDALKENSTVDSKVLANAEQLPFQDKSIDVVIMRYVLQWNTPEVQKNILKQINRVMKYLALIECTGPSNLDAEVWRAHSDELLSGKQVPKMKRGDNFFASPQEIEQWMDEANIQYKQLRSVRIPSCSNIYIERYQLSDDEAETARRILAETDYVQRTDWLLLPKTS